MWKVLHELRHAVPFRITQDQSFDDEDSESEMEPLRKNEVSWQNLYKKPFLYQSKDKYLWMFMIWLSLI